MQTVLIVIHLMVVVALVVVVLLQRSEGGALGIGGGGGGGFFTGRGQANALTRATAILATLFFATSIALTLLAGWGKGRSTSILDGAPGAPISQQTPGPLNPAQSGSSALDDIKNLQRSPAGQPQAPAGQPQAPRSQ